MSAEDVCLKVGVRLIAVSTTIHLPHSVAGVVSHEVSRLTVDRALYGSALKWANHCMQNIQIYTFMYIYIYMPAMFAS